MQENWEKQLLFTLSRAANDTERMILSLKDGRGIGARIRVDQLRAVKRNLLVQQAELWRKIGSSVEAARLDAAAAAIRVDAVYSDMLLRAVTSAEQRSILLEAAEAQARATVDVAVARLNGTSYKPLSDQVYNTRQLSSGLVDRKVTSLLARGVSARELATEMKGFISPNVRGGVSYAAMRLGRTEINNAFHATQVQEAIQSPFIDYLQWKLSGSHPRPDACNEYALVTDVEGQPEGTWFPGKVPSKPHPQCLCYTVPITPSRDDFIKGFMSGKYEKHIDDLLRQSGRSEEWIRASKGAPVEPVIKMQSAMNMTNAQKLDNVGKMYGTSSPQYAKALKRFPL